jgi:hypothetical protein
LSVVFFSAPIAPEGETAAGAIEPGAEPAAAGAGIPGGVGRRAPGGSGGGFGGAIDGLFVPADGVGRGAGTAGGVSLRVGATGSRVERAAMSSSGCGSASDSEPGIFITGICIVRTSPLGPSRPPVTGAYGRVSPGRFDGDRAIGAMFGSGFV